MTRKGEKSRHNTMHHVLVLDESTSMQSLQQLAVDNYNEFCDEVKQIQQEEEDDTLHLIYLIKFSNKATVLHDGVSAKDVHSITSSDYSPKGCTALYDGIGLGCTLVDEKFKEGDGVVFTIVTDGYENRSVDYGIENIRRAIKDRKDRGWMFSYVGCSDVTLMGSNIGISNNVSWTTDESGMNKLKQYRSNTSRAFTKLSKMYGSRVASQVNYGSHSDADADTFMSSAEREAEDISKSKSDDA